MRCLAPTSHIYVCTLHLLTMFSVVLTICHLIVDFLLFAFNTDGYPFPDGWKETVEKSSAESEHILQAFFEKCKERNVRKII